MEGSDEGLVLAQKFKILKKIGSGSFGYIYCCNSFLIQARVYSKNKNLLSK